MTKMLLENSVGIIARKSAKKYRMLDYYLVLKNGDMFYAFSRNYSRGCYDLCRSRVPVNTVLHVRENNKAVMNLKKYLKRMIPYLKEEYSLPSF